MCFYVNEGIDPESWEIDHVSPDMSTLKLKMKCGNAARTIHVHNVYNPSPRSYSSEDSPSTLPLVKQALEAQVEHVVSGDFNLHHPYRNGLSRLTQHAAADQLLDIITAAELELTLPPGTIT